MDNTKSEYSRTTRLAQRVTPGEESDLLRRQAGSLICVGGSVDLPGADTTMRMLVATLRRLPGRIVLLRGEHSSDAIGTIEEAADEIDPTNPIQVVSKAPEGAIRIHVGIEPDALIRVIPERYGAHLIRGSSSPNLAGYPAHALGCMLAAAFGAAEVFAEMIAAFPSRRNAEPHTAWCPVAVSTDTGAAPDLAGPITLDVDLLGVGAIGTAVVEILAESQCEGVIDLVDAQRFARENIGTYSIGTAADVERKPWKVDLAVERLTSRPSVTAHRHPIDVRKFVDAVLHRQLPWSRTLITTFDNVPARHEAQRLWPDHLIDAATGDTFAGLRHSAPGGACLMCLLPLPDADGSSVELLHDRTGLPIQVLAAGDEPLTELDLDGLTESQKSELRPHVGRLRCSLARALGLTSLDAGDYLPAAPFVAQQAACLAVGRLVAVQLGLNVGFNDVQYDVLVGPASGAIRSRAQSKACYCARRADVVAAVRAELEADLR